MSHLPVGEDLEHRPHCLVNVEAWPDDLLMEEKSDEPSQPSLPSECPGSLPLVRNVELISTENNNPK